ncbi:YIP1 family protein [Oceaniglobus ichthyenteri]|uniref:YIP1 family protein n=1 Tax=Oceaniglobus ichthyenteri TaxID=2136177 RepID=UPI000D34AF42|nr:YIP1 family protein [Oceaniglobus ichthyenteri]
MSVTKDILASYRRPGKVVLRRSAGAPREDRALVIVMVACVLIFVAQWPRLSREAFVTDQDFDMLLGASLLAWLFLMPLILYGVAAISHMVAKIMGGRATWYEARIALFWALLAASPLWLLWGLVAGFIGAGPAMDIVGVIAVGAFLAIWISGLWAVERQAEP